MILSKKSGIIAQPPQEMNPHRSHIPLYLKADLKRAAVTYEELAERLLEHGFAETKASIANKLARATMTEHFFLASLAAIGKPGLAIGDL